MPMVKDKYENNKEATWNASSLKLTDINNNDKRGENIAPC